MCGKLGLVPTWSNDAGSSSSVSGGLLSLRVEGLGGTGGGARTEGGGTSSVITALLVV